MNKTTDKFKINDEPILEPHLQVSESAEGVLDESSGTTDDGVMHVRWLRDPIHKFTLQYNLMTPSEYEDMKRLVLGKTFTFTYPKDGVPTPLDCYCTAYGGVLTNVGYTGVQFEIVEL